VSTAPHWSVIVAAYHSDGVIAECLAALRQQNVSDLEVIVVNSSPMDDTARIVTERFPEFRLIESQTRLLPHAARNVGVAEARGDLLVFTDADCRPETDWLEALGKAADAGHEVICGSIGLEGSGYFAAGVHLCKYSFRDPRLKAAPCTIAGTANACYSRKAWERVGPFDGTRFSGDAILSIRAAAAGLRPWYEPRARVQHHYEGNFIGFLGERVARGGDFAEARMDLESWSRARSACYAIALPLLPFVPLARTAGHALASGSLGTYLATLPLQLAGHLAWCLGEFPRHLRRALGQSPARLPIESDS